MKRLSTLALLLLSLAMAAPALADDASALRAGRAWALANDAADAWQAAAAERNSTSVAVLRLDLFTFAGAARLAADRLSDPRVSTDEAGWLIESLEDLAGGCQNSMDRARVGSSTRTAWSEARSSLSTLGDGAPAASGSDDRGDAGSAGEPEPEDPASETETPRDPDAPRAVIAEARWSGTFTPDLVVNGRVEGRGLSNGSLVLKDSSGREVYRSEKPINDAIVSAKQGGPRDGLATATFSIRIDDDDLATGENTIVLTVTDSKGRKAEASHTVTKRLF